MKNINVSHIHQSKRRYLLKALMVTRMNTISSNIRLQYFNYKDFMMVDEKRVSLSFISCELVSNGALILNQLISHHFQESFSFEFYMIPL